VPPSLAAVISLFLELPPAPSLFTLALCNAALGLLVLFKKDMPQRAPALLSVRMPSRNRSYV
jgi:hypothetical protein